MKAPIGVIDGPYAAVAPYAVHGVIWNPPSGPSVAYSGPIYESMTRENDAIRVRFRSGEGGLAAKGEPLSGFTIAGEDRKFVTANARIDGETVVISSPNVSDPIAVRYGDPDPRAASLCDRAGFPASPFRTDGW